MNTDVQNSPSQGPRVADDRLARFNVLAVFHSLDEARHAMDTLGRAGISGEVISLQGPPADHAAAETETAPADTHLLADVFGGVLRWSFIGATAGAVLGIPAGLIAIVLMDGNVTWLSVLGAAFLGALFIGTISGLVALMWPLQDAESWELTYHRDYPGMAVLGVHSEDPKTFEHARQVLGQLKAVNIRVIGQTRGHGVREEANRLAGGRS